MRKINVDRMVLDAFLNASVNCVVMDTLLVEVAGDNFCQRRFYQVQQLLENDASLDVCNVSGNIIGNSLESTQLSKE